jgi:hypothetical protein
MTDQARFLNAGLRRADYTTRSDMLGAGEAVSAADQDALTAQSHERAQDARKHEWKLALERVEKTVLHHESQLRYAERQAARLRTKIAGAG